VDSLNLWDLPKADISRDWLGIYQHATFCVQGKSDGEILGLANRRRIWDVGGQLVDSYLDKVAE
jgi:hypothetical protein